MRKLTPVEARALDAAADRCCVIVPIIGAVLLGGPAAGFAVGAAVAATIIVLARALDEPIEVAPASDERFHLLVVATAPVDDPRTVEAIAAAAHEGERTRSEKVLTS